MSQGFRFKQGSAPQSSGQPQLSPTAKSIISLVLCIHLFCLGVCLFSVEQPSPLLQRLLGILGPYTQLLNFDLDFVPYYLTRTPLLPESKQTYAEREYRWEYLPKGKDGTVPENWIWLGQNERRWSESYRRIQRLAFIPVSAGREEAHAVVAQGIARTIEKEAGLEVAKLRVRQHRPIPYDEFEPSAPQTDGPENYVTFFEVTILRDRSGKLSTLTTVSAAEAAGTRNQTPTTDSNQNSGEPSAPNSTDATPPNNSQSQPEVQSGNPVVVPTPSLPK